MLSSLKEKLKSASHDDILQWTSWLFVFSGCVLAIAFGSYIFNFGLTSKWSSKTEVWGQFGDFIGGTSNPILAFLTLIGLLITLTLQGKQLENSTSELELTRLELARSASAQERAARLTSINLLLAQYQSEILHLKKQEKELVATDPKRKRLTHIEAREQILIATLDELFSDINPSHPPSLDRQQS